MELAAELQRLIIICCGRVIDNQIKIGLLEAETGTSPRRGLLGTVRSTLFYTAVTLPPVSKHSSISGNQHQ